MPYRWCFCFQPWLLMYASTTPPPNLVQDKIPSNRVRECQRLAGEFEAYVANSNALRKVFVSVKGIYYQAVVMNHEITWVVPHRFTQDVCYICWFNNFNYRCLRTWTFASCLRFLTFTCRCLDSSISSSIMTPDSRTLLDWIVKRMPLAPLKCPRMS